MQVVPVGAAGAASSSPNTPFILLSCGDGSKTCIAARSQSEVGVLRTGGAGELPVPGGVHTGG